MDALVAILVWLLQLLNPAQGDIIRELTPTGYTVHEDGSGTFPAYHEIGQE